MIYCCAEEPSLTAREARAMPPMLRLRAATFARLASCRPKRRPRQPLMSRAWSFAPGFIDIHTHADIALLAHPAHLPKIMQGVTTEVFTNCGLGFAPVTEEALRIQRAVHRRVVWRSNREGKGAQDTIHNQKSVNPSIVNWNWRSVADFLQVSSGTGLARTSCI